MAKTNMNQNILKVSVVVLTKNEEKDLPRCLAALSWSDDVHVLDSYSSDATVDIATRWGAHVTQRVFDDWSSHQNWGLRNLPFKYDWVYYSDADEVVTMELVNSIAMVINEPGENVAFRVRRRDYLLGTWLRHVTPSPFNIRLFKPKYISYERATNPITVVNGQIGDIFSHFDHYSFSKGFFHWIEKHNKYSNLEARQIISNRSKGVHWSLWASFFESDINRRRFNQKELFYRLPFRPFVKFIILYLFRFGFLDGRAGLMYALLQSIYEYFIVIKTRELEGSYRP
jgi:glycosyltransferase involved in cell wall biosynthesis